MPRLLLLAVREHGDLKGLDHSVYFGNPNHPAIDNTLTEVEE